LDDDIFLQLTASYGGGDADESMAEEPMLLLWDGDIHVGFNLTRKSFT